MPDLSERRPLRAARLRYRAMTTITYPTDPAIRAKRLAGDPVPVPDDGWTAIEPGEDVPDAVLTMSPWLIRQQHVMPIPDEEGGA